MIDTCSASDIKGLVKFVVETNPGHCIGTMDRSIRDVQVDSRQCGEDSLFVALVGERTDGHRFVTDAFRRGSSLSFVSRQYAESHEAEIAATCRRFGAGAVVVEDPLAALQLLARRRIDLLPATTRIGITGSNGKTTTKELLGAMLERHGAAFVSPGNYNSDIGLPLSCFSVSPRHRFAVFEMGMNRPGEISELVSIARPSYAAVTNIGTAHIGRIGSVEAIAEEKRGIFAHICDGGRGFVPENDPMRAHLICDREECIDDFGPQSTPGYEGSEQIGIEGSMLSLFGRRVRFPLPGQHNVMNALCAITVARRLGVAEEHIISALESADAGFGRGQVLEGRVTVLLDCYNANRQSVLRAFDLLDAAPVTGRKILVLGSMKELGEHSDAEHRAVGRAVAKTTADEVNFVGYEARVAYEAAVSEGVRYAHHYDAYEELARGLPERVSEGDLVLIKGSRSLELERLVRLLDPDLSVEE